MAPTTSRLPKASTSSTSLCSKTTAISFPLGRTASCPAKKKQSRKRTTADSRLFSVGPKKKNWKKQTWDETYEQLVTFKKEHGHCNVKTREFPRLGNWVTIQKGRNRAKLTPEQKQKLDGIGFCWNSLGDRFQTQWEERYNELLKYKQIHGTTQVPKTKAGTDAVLADWVSKQRWMYSNKTLRRDRQEKLEQIGFLWIADETKQWKADRDVSRLDNEWKDMFDKLVEFKRAHGHCLVPWLHSAKKKGVEDEFYSLGRWVRSQRTTWSEGRLQHDRQGKLDTIGFVWRVDSESADSSLHQKQWDEMFERLKMFLADNGHTVVPRGYQDQSLAAWVERQRYFSRNDSLLASRSERLAELGFWFGRNRDEKTPDNNEHYNIAWNTVFEKLKAYKERFGHTRVPHDYRNDPHLGKWARTQRSHAVKGKLVEDRRRRLCEIDFDWTI